MSRLGGIGISASMSGLSARNAAIANMAQSLMQGAQFWAAMQEQRDEARRQRKWQEDQQKKAKKQAQKERWTGAGIGAGAGAAAGVLLAPLTAGASLAAVPAFGTVGSATAGTVGTIGATAGGAAAAGGLSAGGGALLGGVMGAAGGYMGNPTAGASFVQQAQQNAYGNQMAQQQMGMQQERLGMAREELGFRRSRFERENRPISEIAPGAFLPGDMGPPSPNAAMTPPPWQEAGLSPMTTLGEYRDYAEANRDIAYANRPRGGGKNPWAGPLNLLGQIGGNIGLPTGIRATAQSALPLVQDAYIKSLGIPASTDPQALAQKIQADLQAGNIQAAYDRIDAEVRDPYENAAWKKKIAERMSGMSGMP